MSRHVERHEFSAEISSETGVAWRGVAQRDRAYARLFACTPDPRHTYAFLPVHNTASALLGRGHFRPSFPFSPTL